MAITPIKPKGASPLVDMGLNALTGGAYGVIKGLKSGNVGAIASKLAGMGGEEAATDVVTESPSIGQISGMNYNQSPKNFFGMSEGGVVPSKDEKYDPMSQKMDTMKQDPMMLTHEALNLLSDPSIPQELKDKYAEPLLRFKHYGGKK